MHPRNALRLTPPSPDLLQTTSSSLQLDSKQPLPANILDFFTKPQTHRVNLEAVLILPYLEIPAHSPGTRKPAGNLYSPSPSSERQRHRSAFHQSTSPCLKLSSSNTCDNYPTSILAYILECPLHSIKIVAFQRQQPIQSRPK